MSGIESAWRKPRLFLMFTLGASLAHAQPEALDQLNVDGQVLAFASQAPSPVPGLLDVTLTSGERLYVTADGKRFLVGNLFEVQEGGRLVNLTELANRRDRLAALAQAGPDVIRFDAPDEVGVIRVFTDTTCPYCQALHGEVAALNAAGISVHYLPFPRDGLDSEAAAQLTAIWCSDRPAQALSQAFQGNAPDPGAGSRTGGCQGAVANGFELGQRLGVTGTPAFVLPSGELGAGLMPAERLARAAMAAREETAGTGQASRPPE
ncbi:thioredoxin fold domain-containing protein [Azotobacter vinelandii]|uniref:thioredoxin fold domain-containing protein n=1 Tax=Azotobacter vinelandii TaxID=354 RepID=UPI0007739C1C|nr:thioredoxin fold domain-containing protein [Azotobacter vinelandii]